MPDYMGTARLMDDADLLLRTRVAIMQSAIYIRNESPETPNHTERKALADALTWDSSAELASKMLPMMILESGVVNSREASDENIAAAVAGQWNTFALAEYGG